MKIAAKQQTLLSAEVERFLVDKKSLSGKCFIEAELHVSTLWVDQFSVGNVIILLIKKSVASLFYPINY